MIAFASNRAQDAQPEIYALSLDGRRSDISRSIVPDGYPQPSPDGSRVAFQRTDSSGAEWLVLADADGSHQRVLAQWAPVSWAPDSRRLVASVNVGGRPTVAVFDAQTGGRTLLDRGVLPQWSPDGSLIAASETPVTDQSAVFVERPDGSGRVDIGHGYDTRWSPDSAHVLVTTTPYASAVLSRSGALPVPLPPSFAPLTWTPDGSRLIGTTTTSVTALESVSSDGTDARVIGETAVTADRDLLSPDGRRLVFVRPTDGHVVVTDIEGTVVRDLGSRPWPEKTVFDPRWSPDGGHVLLWSAQRQPLVADVATGAVQTLAVAPAETTDQPVWSPDGSVLAAIRDTRTNTDVYVARADGTGARRLFGDGVREDTPAWSPDGTRVAFIREVGSGTLVVSDLHGHARTVARVSGGRPAWSADGTHIAVAVSGGVEIVDARTGRTHIVRGHYSDATGISPDGRSVAYVYGAPGGRLRIGVDSRNGRRLWSVAVGLVSSDYDPPQPGNAGDLAWSPNGRWLAFRRWGSGEYGDFDVSIRVLDARSHRIVAALPIGTSPLSWDVYGPAESLVLDGFGWSPDSRELVEGGFDAQITRLDGHRTATLAGLRAEDPVWQPHCTRSGTRRNTASVSSRPPTVLALVRSGSHVVAAHVDARTLQPIPGEPTSPPLARDFKLRWTYSPNGRTLAVAGTALWDVDARTLHARRRGQPSVDRNAVVWLPSGRYQTDGNLFDMLDTKGQLQDWGAGRHFAALLLARDQPPNGTGFAIQLWPQPSVASQGADLPAFTGQTSADVALAVNRSADRLVVIAGDGTNATMLLHAPWTVRAFKLALPPSLATQKDSPLRARWVDDREVAVYDAGGLALVDIGSQTSRLLAVTLTRASVGRAGIAAWTSSRANGLSFFEPSGTLRFHALDGHRVGGAVVGNRYVYVCDGEDTWACAGTTFVIDARSRTVVAQLKTRVVPLIPNTERDGH